MYHQIKQLMRLCFTDCQVIFLQNACVIVGDKPMFLNVSDILKMNTDHTVSLLKLELEIELGELEEKWHFASLEKIFIENEIYQEIKNRTSKEEVYSAIDLALNPFTKHLMREVTVEDIIRLTELPFMRISRYVGQGFGKYCITGRKNRAGETPSGESYYLCNDDFLNIQKNTERIKKEEQN
jgi:hypothetical protein